MAPDYRRHSLWLDTLAAPVVPRAPLQHDVAADVVVVGAGFIGLWTAYCLARAEPALEIVVLEAEIAGFGAAGRNAGFVSAGIAGQAQAYLSRCGWEGIRRAERAMIEGIDYVGKVVAEEGIECGWTKGGSLRIATSPAQLKRVRGGIESRRRRGLDESDVDLLGATEVAARVKIAGVIGGAFTPHCARVHPARLVRGLAEACERRGVRIFERSRAIRIDSGRIQCAPSDGHAAALARAPIVVQATEAFTVDLPGYHRDYLPVFSHMVATEPLDDVTWAAIGWEKCETVADQRHLFTYAQRTVDGRTASAALSGPSTSARRRCTPSSSGRSARGFPPPPEAPSRIGGEVHSPCRATGACRSSSIAPRGSRAPVGSRVTAWSRPASVAGRSPI
jgi:glycine/D-amino acid oxidase-like deaminating enzyme